MAVKTQVYRKIVSKEQREQDVLKSLDSVVLKEFWKLPLFEREAFVKKTREVQNTATAIAITKTLDILRQITFNSDASVGIQVSRLGLEEHIVKNLATHVYHEKMGARDYGTAAKIALIFHLDAHEYFIAMSIEHPSYNELVASNKKAVNDEEID